MTKALEFPFSNLLASPWLVPKPIPHNSYFKTPSLPQAPKSPPLSVPIGSQQMACLIPRTLRWSSENLPHFLLPSQQLDLFLHLPPSLLV